MNIKSDTVMVLGDVEGTFVYIRERQFSTADRAIVPIARSSTVATISSATVQIFPVSRAGEGLFKDERGEVIATTHKLFLPRTSSVTVVPGNRIYEKVALNGNDDLYWIFQSNTNAAYYDVARVDTYDGHLRIWATLVEGK